MPKDDSDTPGVSEHAPSSSTSSFSKLKVDYVIVFSLAPLKQTKIKDKAAHASELAKEYTLLIERLNAAGLTATGRPGAKGTNELLILVTAHDEARIRQEMDAERLADWLHGITSIKPEAELSHDQHTKPYTSAERLRQLYNIITRDATPPSNRSPVTAHPHRALVGIGAGVIPGHAPFTHVKSIFPPHDLDFNQRWLSSWSDRSHLTITIPEIELDKIKEVYGESIGYYFAFLNFYFQALVLPTGLGFLFWLAGNAYSATYGALLVLWSIVFVESWAVKERLLAIKWNSFSCHKVERTRVQFKPEGTVKHRVTNEDVGFFPWWKREIRKLVTIPVLIMFGASICAIIGAITAVELLVAEVYKGTFKKSLALLPTVLFAASVPQLVQLWQSTAVKLSNWENHAYTSAYDRSLTHKMFAVHGVVAYAGLVLTAFVYVPFGSLLVPHLATLAHKFIKRDSITLEGPADQYVDAKALDLSTYSINKARLYEQLFTYQVTNQLVNTFIEIGLPSVMKLASLKWKKIRNSKATAAGAAGSTVNADEPDERELLERLREEAARPEYHLFVEYAEMAIQFGYVVLWTVVWPISPVFAFVNNFFELRTDAIKLAKHTRRPVPCRCDSIGPWQDVLSALTWLGAIVNVALVHLFTKPLSAASSESDAKEGSPMIVAELLTAAIVDSKTGACEGPPGSSGLYERLAPIVLSGLISTLLAEYAFGLMRGAIRESIGRLMWRNSDAEVKRRKADWELKRSFIENLENNPLRITQSDFSSLLRTERKSGIIDEDEAKFWGREDVGIQEIQRLAKTE